MFESFGSGKNRNVQPDAEALTAGKILVRNLPLDVFKALVEIAETHDRSVEAEARMAIRNWVKEWIDSKSQNSRCMQVSQRLRYIIDEINCRPGRNASPSRIAEAMGRSHASEVERWCAGLEEPSFEDIKAVASLLMCDFGWLAHGEGTPYKPIYQRIPENPSDGMSWLLESPDSRPVKTVGLIRSKSEAGEFAYYKQYSDWSIQVFSTPYHVSEVIGAGGEASLAALLLLFEALYKKHTKSGAEFQVTGYLVDDDVFSALLSGKRHPLNVLDGPNSYFHSTWWEDVWDPEMFEKQNYWEGWRSLTARMHRVIERKDFYRKDQEIMHGSARDSNAV